MKSYRLFFRTLQGLSLILILPLATTYHPGAVEVDAMKPATAEIYFTLDADDPVRPKPDRRLDYLAYAQSLRVENTFILQATSRGLSDHFPNIAEPRLPTNASVPSTRSATRS